MLIIRNMLQMYASLKIQILLLQFTTHMEMVSAAAGVLVHIKSQLVEIPMLQEVILAAVNPLPSMWVLVTIIALLER